MLSRIDANVQIGPHVILIKECMARMAASGERFHYPAVLFRCSDRPPGRDDNLGWTRHLANLHVVRLSGNHDNVLQMQNAEPIVVQLTATLSPGEGILPGLGRHLYVN